jgi:hypothetical protein
LSELLLTRKYEDMFPDIDVFYQLLSTFKMQCILTKYMYSEQQNF